MSNPSVRTSRRAFALACFFFFHFFTTGIRAEKQKAEFVTPPAPAPELSLVLADIDKAYARATTEDEMIMTVGLHTPWHVVHGLLAYGDKLTLKDPKAKKNISALDWVRNGGIWREHPTFLTSPAGFIGNTYGPEFQGHMAQFGGYLSELGLPFETKFMAWNQKDKKWEPRLLSQLYEDIKQNVTIKEEQGDEDESSWALWALLRSGYSKIDDTWKNVHGEEVTFEKLVNAEAIRDINTAPCGGLHGLYGMSIALQKYRETGKPLTGSWIVADFIERKYLMQAKRQQNDDGSFSADYFHGSYKGEDWRESLSGNGHIFEWLAMMLPDEELTADWMVLGAHSVAKNMLEAEVNDGDIEKYIEAMHNEKDDEKLEKAYDGYTTLGGYFHAAHGLKTYRDRIVKIRGR